MSLWSMLPSFNRGCAAQVHFTEKKSCWLCCVTRRVVSFCRFGLLWAIPFLSFPIDVVIDDVTDISSFYKFSESIKSFSLSFIVSLVFCSLDAVQYFYSSLHGRHFPLESIILKPFSPPLSLGSGLFSKRYFFFCKFIFRQVGFSTSITFFFLSFGAV